MSLLSVENLAVAYRGDGGGETVVVDGVDLTIDKGRTLGLVGESGSGKSVTARAIMRLLPEPPARVLSGRVVLDGEDLLRLPERRMRDVRGNRIAMIFQEPMTSLNPTLSVGFQVEEGLRLHTNLDRAGRRGRALDLLHRVGIGAPEQRLKQYPHELSGGLRQRVMIAGALACGPDLLIADEPTTALDVTVQAQILDLLDDLRRDAGMGVLLITHDLGVVGGHTDEVAVMYAGRIVEWAATADLFEHPRHPYTGGLVASMPRLDGPRGVRLAAIPGTVPPPGKRAPGCPFVDRCDRALTRCAPERPPLAGADGRAFACWNPLA